MENFKFEYGVKQGTNINKQLLDKPYVNEVTLKGQKSTLEMLLVSWTFDKVIKGVRSFYAENLGSVSQRATKLPAIKLWEWFDPWPTQIQADWFKWGQGWALDFFLRTPT